MNDLDEAADGDPDGVVLDVGGSALEQVQDLGGRASDVADSDGPGLDSEQMVSSHWGAG